MLFSATLNKNLHELAKLSLSNPEYIFLHDAKAASQVKDGGVTAMNIYETPARLTQYCMTLKIGEKLDILFSFMKSHLKQKILVFFSTCKQVRFAYEAFRRLKVGMPIYELHGRQK